MLEEYPTCNLFVFKRLFERAVLLTRSIFNRAQNLDYTYANKQRSFYLLFYNSPFRSLSTS